MHRVFSLSRVQVALLAEAAVTLTASALMVRCLPFRWLAPRLGSARCESAPDDPRAASARVQQIGWALSAAARRVPMPCSCLVQAVAGKAMLRRRKIASTLYLGVDTASGAPLKAHAWLRCGTFVVTGSSSRDQFATVVTFAEADATASADP